MRVGIVVGSESDLPVMNTCGEVLDGYGIGWEIGVMSAHRAGDVVRAYALAAPGARAARAHRRRRRRRAPSRACSRR